MVNTSSVPCAGVGSGHVGGRGVVGTRFLIFIVGLLATTNEEAPRETEDWYNTVVELSPTFGRPLRLSRCLAWEGGNALTRVSASGLRAVNIAVSCFFHTHIRRYNIYITQD